MGILPLHLPKVRRLNQNWQVNTSTNNPSGDDPSIYIQETKQYSLQEGHAILQLNEHFRNAHSTKWNSMRLWWILSMIHWSSWQSNGTNCTCQNSKKTAKCIISTFHSQSMSPTWSNPPSASPSVFCSRTFGWNDYSLRVGKHDNSRALICVYGRNINLFLNDMYLLTLCPHQPAKVKKSWSAIVRYAAVGK